jgi:glycine reductase
VRTNRIVPGAAIPHPVGDYSNGPEDDRRVRRELLERALKALQAKIDDRPFSKKSEMWRSWAKG